MPCMAAAVADSLLCSSDEPRLTPFRRAPVTPHLAGPAAFFTYWYTSLPPAFMHAKPRTHHDASACETGAAAAVHAAIRCSAVWCSPTPAACSRTRGLHDPSAVGLGVVGMAPARVSANSTNSAACCQGPEALRRTTPPMRAVCTCGRSASAPWFAAFRKRRRKGLCTSVLNWAEGWEFHTFAHACILCPIGGPLATDPFIVLVNSSGSFSLESCDKPVLWTSLAFEDAAFYARHAGRGQPLTGGRAPHADA